MTILLLFLSQSLNQRKFSHKIAKVFNKTCILVWRYVTYCVCYFFISISRPVKLKDFAEHYRKMSADSDFRFSEEFEELKRVGRDQLCTAADLPVNRPKNRFTNILPYDQSRFKLQPTDDDEGSDYINANYVTVIHSVC